MDRSSNPKISAIFRFFKENKKAEVFQAIRNALQTSEGDSEEKKSLLFMLGFLYSVGRKYQKAVDCYKKYSEEKPGSSSILNNMGCDYRFLGYQEKAVECFLRSLELQNNFPPALMNLGATYVCLGKYDCALDCFLLFEKAVKGTFFAGQLAGPIMDVLFEVYSLHMKKILDEDKSEEAHSFAEERLSFVQSLPSNLVLSALIFFFMRLIKMEKTVFVAQVLAFLGNRFPHEVVQAMEPFAVALQYLESGREEVFLEQNLELRDAVSLIIPPWKNQSGDAW